MSIHVDWIWDPIFGPKLAAQKLAALEISIRVGGFRQPLQRSVREVLVPNIERQFAAGGVPKWRRLAPATVENKVMLYGRSDPILTARGTLRRAATAYARWRVREDEAIFTGLPGHAYYGMFHLTGTRKMPVRDWARWDRATKDKVARIFDEWLDQKIKAVF